MLIGMLKLHGGVCDFIAALDFGVLGYLIVGMFLLAWASSVGWWKLGGLERRHAASLGSHAHPHVHEGGTRHSHHHIHRP